MLLTNGRIYTMSESASEPGKRADLVVCSDDVFTWPESVIPEIRPALTLCGRARGARS